MVKKKNPNLCERNLERNLLEGHRVVDELRNLLELLKLLEPSADEIKLYLEAKKKKPAKEKEPQPTESDEHVRSVLDTISKMMSKPFLIDPRWCTSPPQLIQSRGFYINHMRAIKKYLYKLGNHCNQKSFYIAIGEVW